MAKISTTGSADGLEQLAKQDLVNMEHRVVQHADNKERGAQAL